MTDTGRPVERAVEVLVYAPLGFAMFVKDLVPGVVDQLTARGRAEVQQLQQKLEGQVGQARIIGRFAVSQGGDQLRREVTNRVQEARQRGEDLARQAGLASSNGVTPAPAATTPAPAPAPAPTPAPAPAPVVETAPIPEPAAPSPTAVEEATEVLGGETAPVAPELPQAVIEAPPAGSLGIPDYDGLSASQVVARLAGLDAAELEAVRAYESARRSRKTVLSRIEQLARSTR